MTDSVDLFDSQPTPAPGDDAPSQQLLDTTLDTLASAEPEQRESYYVQAADEMIASVLDKEDFLFDEAELTALSRFTGLSYEGRCLFMRLYLRKHQWVRINGLKYERDIKDLEGAVRELCARQGEVEAVEVKSELKADHVEVKGEIEDSKPVASTSKQTIEVLELSSDEEEDVKPKQIDLTLSDTDDDEKPIPTPAKKRSPTPPPPPPIPEQATEPDYSALAHDTSWLSTAEPTELFKLLSLEEIITLGKKMKADPGKGKNNVSLLPLASPPPSFADQLTALIPTHSVKTGSQPYSKQVHSLHSSFCLRQSRPP